ncbi:MAG: hypothetical protein RLZZ262_1558 [Bacteroidota bacterium]|jgi:hypothetical protein
MLRYIIAVCIGLCCIKGFGQQWPIYAEQMEFRFMQCTDAECRSYVLAEKLDSAFHSAELLNYAGDVLRDMNRLNLSLLTEEKSADLLWNAALLAYSTGAFSDARKWWKEYAAAHKETETESLFLGFLIDMELDSARALSHLNRLIQRDSAFVPMKSLAYDRWKMEQPRKWYVLAGFLLPGSGLIAEGYVMKGITALILNSGVAIAVIALLRANLYFNVASWGLLLVQKFYLGHINLTRMLSYKAHPRRLAKKQDQYYNEIQGLLKMYPLEWK